jgi:hypothetical protein
MALNQSPGSGRIPYYSGFLMRCRVRGSAAEVLHGQGPEAVEILESVHGLLHTFKFVALGTKLD